MRDPEWDGGPEPKTQNPELGSPDSKIQKGKSRPRIQDPQPFCRHKTHGSGIQFLHCRPQIPGEGFQNPGFGLGLPPISDSCSPASSPSNAPGRQFLLGDSDKSFSLINAY